MKNYAAIGTCIICGQGRLIIAKERSSGSLFIVCEECESEWHSPEASKSIDTATRDAHGQYTLLVREDLDDHPWKTALW